MKFAIIGAAGYVAPRHMKAIAETNNDLIAALDPNDSIGVLDKFFIGCKYFNVYERFDRYLEKIKNTEDAVNYISICSPNYLHDAHCRLAMRLGANAICEKPLVLNPWNIAELEKTERETGKRVYNILQLRLHSAIKRLKQQISKKAKDTKYDVDLTYITARGNWYFNSWKGDIDKSGGIATNIGIHFFDMLIWLFGPVQQNDVHLSLSDKAAGFLELEQARVRWFLSVDIDTLPNNIIEKKQYAYRSVTINGQELDFTGGFMDLHNASYEDILNGGGFSLSCARPSIETVSDIRNAKPLGLVGEYHPILKQVK